MSDQTSTNRTVVIGLVVVAVLLAATAGALIWRQNNQPVPQAASGVPSQEAITGKPAAQAPATAQGGTTGAPSGMPGGMPGASGGAAAPAEVDPASATKVPKGTEPEAFVKAYYEACAADDWETAFKSLPADKQAGSSPDSLKEQVSGYGVKSYEVTGATTEGDNTLVKVDQVTGSYGTFENTWTFVKKDGTWYVANKAVTGMK